ncbi:MAG: hypothetical protein U0800_07865 [Isosphaeraceae bacterium]
MAKPPWATILHQAPPMNRFQSRGIRDYARRTALDLIARGITDRDEFRERNPAQVLRWVEPTEDPAEHRDRLASIGYGVAQTLGIDVGPDPGELLPAPIESLEADLEDAGVRGWPIILALSPAAGSGTGRESGRLSRVPDPALGGT